MSDLASLITALGIPGILSVLVWVVKYLIKSQREDQQKERIAQREASENERQAFREEMRIDRQAFREELREERISRSSEAKATRDVLERLILQVAKCNDSTSDPKPID